jgi:hypothetical protein
MIWIGRDGLHLGFAFSLFFGRFFFSYLDLWGSHFMRKIPAASFALVTTRRQLRPEGHSQFLHLGLLHRRGLHWEANTPISPINFKTTNHNHHFIEPIEVKVNKQGI